MADAAKLTIVIEDSPAAGKAPPPPATGSGAAPPKSPPPPPTPPTGGSPAPPTPPTPPAGTPAGKVPGGSPAGKAPDPFALPGGTPVTIPIADPFALPPGGTPVTIPMAPAGKAPTGPPAGTSPPPPPAVPPGGPPAGKAPTGPPAGSYGGTNAAGVPNLLADPDPDVVAVPPWLAKPPDEEARRARARKARGEAWRKNKTYERRVKNLDWRKKGGYAGSAARKLGSAARGAKAVASGSAGAVLGGAAGLIGKAGPVGAVIGAFGEAVGAASETVKAFVARGKELSVYSAPLAAATAKADVQAMQSDLREAEKNGESMAELVEAAASMEAIFKEIMLPIKAVICDVLVGVMNAVMWSLEKIIEGINKLTFGLAAGDVLAELKRIRAAMTGSGTDLIDGWLLGGTLLTAPKPLAVPPAAPLAVPLVTI